MQFIDVSSSNIRRIGYSKEDSKLAIEFKDGSIYEYFSVPKSIFDNLLSAPSKGNFIHKNIKGKFEYRKIN